MKTENDSQLTTMEPATFEVVQADLFKDYIHREGSLDLSFEETTPFEVWESYTRGILEMGRRCMRDAGQCLLFGERKYGEKYAQVIDSMRYSPKTLQNATWVVKSVKHWHDTLSFAHHEVVAALPPKAQEEMLTIADKEGLTVSKLKKAKNEKYPEKKKDSKLKKVNAPKIDLQDENEMLQAGHMIIAFLEKEEADLPFRKWPKIRLDKWSAILGTFRKIHRRTGLIK